MSRENRVYIILGLVITACACIAGYLALPQVQKLFVRPTPTAASFDYQVRVIEQGIGKPIPDAKVTIHFGGGAVPKDEYTDSNGLARIFIDSSYAGKAGRLLVEATGYEPFSQNLDLSKDALPEIVQLIPPATPIVVITQVPTQLTDTPPVPTLTANPVLLPGQDFDIGCIDSQFWRHREEASTPKEYRDDRECWRLSRFGIVAENGLKIDYASALTYWLLTPIKTSNTEIHFKVSVHDIAPIKKDGGDAFIVFGVGNAEYNVFKTGYFILYGRDQSESSKAKVSYGTASNPQFLANYIYGTTHEVKMIVKDTQMHLEVHDLSTGEFWEKDFIISPTMREAFWIGYNISNGSNSSISASITELVVAAE